MSEELVREVVVRPAFDRRHPEPRKNYGIHGADLCFYLKGEKGAVQFIVYTNWHLPHVQVEMDAKPLGNCPYLSHKPLPADIGYHAKVPQYEGQDALMDDCDLTGGKCYYDGSGLMAEDVFRVLVEGGTDALWREMEWRYQNLVALTTQEQNHD